MVGVVGGDAGDDFGIASLYGRGRRAAARHALAPPIGIVVEPRGERPRLLGLSDRRSGAG